MTIDQVCRENPTDRVRSVLKQASQLATGRGEHHVGTAHALLSFFECGGVALEVLRRSGIDSDDCDYVLSANVLTEEATDKSNWTDRMRMTMDVAVTEKKELGHPYLGTEHILLAMARVENSAASQVLNSFNLTHERLRTCVLKVLGHPPDE